MRPDVSAEAVLILNRLRDRKVVRQLIDFFEGMLRAGRHLG
jgi:hypothetical protein